MASTTPVSPCSRCRGCAAASLSRRGFLGAAAGAAFAPLAPASPGQRQQPVSVPLKVQPVLVFDIPSKREGTSFRHWGGLLTEADAAGEKERIARELKSLAASGPPVDFLPLRAVRTPEEAAAAAAGPHDLLLMYAAGGGVKTLETLIHPERWTLMFLRHRSGPVSLWYEIAHPRLLRKTVDEFGQPGLGIEDVVVDSQEDVALRLRALYGLKNTLGKRIVAVGGPSGWGAGGRQAPEIARAVWKLDIRTVGYPELSERIQRARADGARVKRCAAEAARYLGQKGVSLETSREFVDKAFLLTDVFRDLLDEARTDAITINQCMGTIMKVSETTACLPLSVLNDQGYLAFCESDFVVIPSGILLRYVSNKPVFLNDPTHPHHNLVTIAHCTAPRKMDGQTAEPVRILTHFESDYGAAPKVEMRVGQKVTNLIPDFANRQWVGFEGVIEQAPFLAICRSQADVRFAGQTEKLLAEMKGFHWMTSYGTYVRESRYALSKIGVGMTVV